MKQNDISAMRTTGSDLSSRWESILGKISIETGFVPDRELLRQSEWWKTGKIGAVHYPGIIVINGQKLRAVLKIQGTKPPTSEVEMIEKFAAQNQSKIIRPPKIYTHLPWNETDEYEAIIFEEASGKPVIADRLASDEQLTKYFKLYEEYRKNCLNSPWVEKPKFDGYKDRLHRWKEAVAVQRENDTLAQPEDENLAQKGTEILEHEITDRDLEFMHGHFQPGDLIVSGSDVVLFSNLMWGWRQPFYDAVFGYHWAMLGMEHVEDFTAELLETERKRWLDKIFKLEAVKGKEKLLNLALLERAIPALLVDRHLLDVTKPSAAIITEACRRELKRLISELS